MQQALLAAVALATLALAGCSGGGDHSGAQDFTCADGSVVPAATIEAADDHHDAAFDPATLCPVPPQVTLTGLPASLQVYGTSSFEWSVNPGSVLHGHSMLTAIRYSMSSVPDGQATLDTYSKEVLKKEHQDLPVSFRGNLTFNVPGPIYLRAYAQVQGDGYDRRDVWSPEVMLEILPVQPTGVVATVVHAVGPIGGLDPNDIQLNLGDALVFQNDDLLAHDLTATSGPAGSVACDLAAAAGDVSEPCVFIVPGSYTFTTDDVQPKSVTVSVVVPA